MANDVLTQFNKIVNESSRDKQAAVVALQEYQNLLKAGAKNPIDDAFLQGTKGRIVPPAEYSDVASGIYYPNIDTVILNYVRGVVEPNEYFDTLIHELQHRADTRDKLQFGGFEEALREYLVAKHITPLYNESYYKTADEIRKDVKKAGIDYGPGEITAHVMPAMRGLPANPSDDVLDLLEKYPELFGILYKNRAIPGITKGPTHYKGESEYSTFEKVLDFIGLLPNRAKVIYPGLPPAAKKRLQNRKEANERN